MFQKTIMGLVAILALSPLSAQVQARDGSPDSPVHSPAFTTRELNFLSSLNATADLYTRDTGELFCCPVANWDWPWAYSPCVIVGLQDLVEQGGICGCPPHTCELAMCRCGSEIWICNDNDFYIEPTCLDVAIYAANIVNNCGFGQFSCGQQFDTQHWDVIVHGSCTGCTNCPGQKRRVNGGVEGDKGLENLYRKLQREAQEAWNYTIIFPGHDLRDLDSPSPALDSRGPSDSSLTEREVSQSDGLHPAFAPLHTRNDLVGLIRRELNESGKVTSILDTRNPGPLECFPINGQPWTVTKVTWIEDDIKFLVEQEGAGTKCKAPPLGCEIQACENSASVWLCNNSILAASPSCLDVAIYATDIINKCQSSGYAGGRAFDTADYSVIVRNDIEFPCG